MSLFPGDVKVYRSNDSVEENEHQYPIEFLNTLCPSGMPRAPHTLQLKKHSIIMLLCNLDPVNGHCNGTRYVIEYLHDHIIDATIACGPNAGKRMFVPIIPMIPSDHIFPFHMKRKKFPVRPAFAITSTWATLCCHESCWLKRQPQNYSDHGVYTSNVVYKEVLRQ